FFDRLDRRNGRRRRWPTLYRSTAQNEIDVRAIDGFVLKERLGQYFQLVYALLQAFPGHRIALHDNALDLGIDGARGLLRIVLVLRKLPTEKDLLFLLAEGEGAHLFTHAPLADHLARQIGRLLDVVTRPRGHLPKHDLLGDSPTEANRDSVLRPIFGKTEPV